VALASPVYPVGLVLAGRRALVVGGGRVAARKVPALLACDARVTVVAPEISDELVALAGDLVDLVDLVDLQRRPYRSGEVAGYAVVIAATGRPEVDRAVFTDGEAAGVLVNAADDAAACSFVLPAVLRRGAVSVAVSTDGTSPALAAWLRDRIAGELGPELAELAELLGATREEVRAGNGSSEGLGWTALIDELAGLLDAGRRADAEELAHNFARHARAARAATPGAGRGLREIPPDAGLSAGEIPPDAGRGARAATPGAIRRRLPAEQ
jgi:siroheme synthase-like protein